MQSGKEKQLADLLSPLVDEMGYELVGIEYNASYKNRLLRLYIDKPEGIALDDCESVSREVGAFLDIENPIDGEYTLEVSSPGLERPLFSLAHFDRFVGKNAKIKLYKPLDGQRNFIGTIKPCQGDEVVLEVDSNEVKIPFDSIASARLIFEE